VFVADGSLRDGGSGVLPLRRHRLALDRSPRRQARGAFDAALGFALAHPAAKGDELPQRRRAKAFGVGFTVEPGQDAMAHHRGPPGGGFDVGVRGHQLSMGGGVDVGSQQRVHTYGVGGDRCGKVHDSNTSAMH